MDLDFSKIEFADPCIDLGASLKIEYHSLSARITPEDMKELKRRGMSSTITMCIMYAMRSTGMSYEEGMEFLQEARKCKARIDFKLYIGDGEDERDLTPDEEKRLHALMEMSQYRNKMKNMRPS